MAGAEEHGSNPDVSRRLMAAAGSRLAGFWSWISGSGYDGSPAVGPGGRGSIGPGFSFLLAGTCFVWSKWVRDGVDALPGGDDLV